MTANEIREKYLRFFESKGHRIAPSDSLIPADDPSLLFTGSGMNQFKEQFLGRNITYARAASCQKCVRTGDLDNVGRTAGHHTFFEMLGNFSFGDYFKRDAIAWGWEFMTQVLRLPEERLWVSVYADDDEAYGIWKEAVRIPPHKIKRYGAHDNFWPADAPAMGPNGPCGPCSEIFYDQGETVGCRKATCEPSCSCDRFIEVWNLVFTQFNRAGVNKLEPLKNKNIDTGMGLERVTAVMQGAKTNFETDLFRPIVENIRPMMKGNGGPNAVYKVKAVADHARAVAFLIGDGVLPSNEQRGYVVRMLVRRAFRFGKELGISLPFLYKVIPSVTRVMKVPYPELEKMRENISDIVKSEEERFLNTLEEGTRVLDEIIAKAKAEGGKTISGGEAFRLYDTYGFPLELTKETAALLGFSVDKEGYDKAMEAQRARARKGSSIKNEIFGGPGASDGEDAALKGIKPTVFLGYKKTKAESDISAIIKSGAQVHEAGEGEKVKVVLDKTPFYGESGGQVGDCGWMRAKGATVRVNGAVRRGDITLHDALVEKGVLKKGDKIECEVDAEKRRDTARNHTATHLLHHVLREVLGKHVKQAGSLVAPDRLRFDFAHHKAVESRALERIEELLNGLIRENMPVRADEMAYDDARERGAIALFGEKYGEKVRMVSMGDSKELCGGTHVSATGEIGLFKIISESSIAGGTRRIEAVTGRGALDMIKGLEEKIAELAGILRSSPKDVIQSAKNAAARIKELEKELAAKESGSAASALKALAGRAARVAGIGVACGYVGGIGVKGLRDAADKLLDITEKPAIAVLFTESAGKGYFVCSASREAVEAGTSASDIVRMISSAIGGSGGGTPKFAQGGTKDAAGIKEAAEKAFDLIKRELGK